MAEQYEVLAHHFAEAAEWVKALDYLRKAAEKATQAFAIREALALYERALEVAGRPGGPTSGRRHRHPPGPVGAVLPRERLRPIAGRGRARVSLAREAGDPAREARR